ncbi:FAD-dependent oxidoreductase [Robertmurraya massiliosenegalensis]|uniref:FAD-dependent oxidoreductase n=1 Tax=Robertmurraya TaxID=2837507 RepID=UPI0039A524EC
MFKKSGENMSETEKFDAIIIGAGPAGIACAYTLAKEGKEVLVIERGDTAGSKNVTGGRFYTYALEMVDEGLTEDAALERKVTHEQIMMLSDNRAISIDYHDPSFSEGEVPQSYTILRASFDEWFAGKAEEMGAMVAYGIKVDDLIEKDGKIVGVIAGEDEMYADVIVAADGVNSFIAQKAGLIEDIQASTVAVGVKEIIELPAKVIEQRFNLKSDEGAARLMLGGTEGIHGGGFLYTNKESISLGMVLMPEEVAQNGRSIHSLFQELKMHPAIYSLIEGGKTVEYGAHLVAEEGYRGIPKKIYREGLLVAGEAAGTVVNLGYTIRGIDLAILSGLAAARAIIRVENPANMGSTYLEELENVRLLPMMRAYDGFTDALNIPNLFKTYPNVAVELFQTLYAVDGNVPNSLKKQIVGVAKNNRLTVWQLLKDGLRGRKAL